MAISTHEVDGVTHPMAEHGDAQLWLVVGITELPDRIQVHPLRVCYTARMADSLAAYCNSHARPHTRYQVQEIETATSRELALARENK